MLLCHKTIQQKPGFSERTGADESKSGNELPKQALQWR